MNDECVPRFRMSLFLYIIIFMHHSQLKIKYPDCPFVWDYDDMTQLFSPVINSTDKEKLLQEINDQIVESLDTNYKRSEDEYRKILKFLVDLTDNEKTQNVYDNINYVSITQKIPKTKNEALINFHTSVYRDDNDNFLSKEISENIAWTMIPILGNVESREIKYEIIENNDTTNNKIINVGLSNRSLDPMTYENGKIDNKYGIIEANIKNIRVAKRNFIKRSFDADMDQKIEPELQKKDSQPRFKQIDFNNNTRASASLIRDRLNSTYKMNRMRNNPELMKQQKKVDMSLRNISQKNTEIRRNRELDIMNSQHVVIQDQFDYIHDTVVIQKVNQVLRFGPNQSGKIKFNLMYNQSNVLFITILRYKNHLHITLHKINFY